MLHFLDIPAQSFPLPVQHTRERRTWSRHMMRDRGKQTPSRGKERGGEGEALLLQPFTTGTAGVNPPDGLHARFRRSTSMKVILTLEEGTMKTKKESKRRLRRRSTVIFSVLWLKSPSALDGALIPTPPSERGGALPLPYRLFLIFFGVPFIYTYFHFNLSSSFCGGGWE